MASMFGEADPLPSASLGTGEGVCRAARNYAVLLALLDCYRWFCFYVGPITPNLHLLLTFFNPVFSVVLPPPLRVLLLSVALCRQGWPGDWGGWRRGRGAVGSEPLSRGRDRRHAGRARRRLDSLCAGRLALNCDGPVMDLLWTCH
jgi:hypothetical protein